MNKAIAHTIKEALIGLPYIDKYGGLVFPLERKDVLYDEVTGNPQPAIVKRLPVTSDYTITRDGDCNSAEVIDFVPSQEYKGMLYFEDGGIDPIGRKGRFWMYSSKLQLVAWLNTKGLMEDQGDDPPTALNMSELSIPLFTVIQGRLEALQNTNAGNLLRMKVRILRILPQSRALFSQYNYDEAATQYLMPPFEFFGLSLAVDFSTLSACAPELVQTDVIC